MGIKGLRSRLAAGRVQRKTHKQGSAFLPEGNCRGYGRTAIGAAAPGCLSGNRGKSFMDLRCEFRKNKCCIYLPGVPQTERKERKDRRASARRAGLRILGLVQKTGMVNVHLADHTTYQLNGWAFDDSRERCRFDSGICIRQRVYGFRKENQLIVLQYEHL